jgi:hypothetical protein
MFHDAFLHIEVGSICCSDLRVPLLFNYRMFRDAFLNIEIGSFGVFLYMINLYVQDVP